MLNKSNYSVRIQRKNNKEWCGIRYYLIKHIAVFLCANLILLSFPVVSLADDIEDDDSENIVNEISQETVETSNNQNQKPTVNSRRYVIYDRNSGMAIYGKDENKQSAMASTTKILTGIVVLENCKNLDEEVIIDAKSAGVGGSRLGLKKDDRITVNDLLFGLLLKSGNDAATQLAVYTSGSIEEFANLMNRKAKELGLNNTHLVTPHGLDDPNHYTTPYELAKIADYALKNETFATIVKTKYATIRINGNPKEIKNTNELLCGDYEGVYGVKTGFTNNAGRCLVTAVKRGDMDLIIVVLGADTRKDRANDTVKLVNYAFQNFKNINIEEKVKADFEDWKNINQDRIYINKAGSKLELGLEEINIKQIATNKEITTEINSINYLEAPVAKNTKIGTLTVKNGEEIIEQTDIITSKKVNRLGVVDYLTKFAKCICN